MILLYSINLFTSSMHFGQYLYYLRLFYIILSLMFMNRVASHLAESNIVQSEQLQWQMNENLLIREGSSVTVISKFRLIHHSSLVFMLTNLFFSGMEGRAGMIVIELIEGCDSLDCDGLYKHACSNLPAYARPVFVR